MIQFRNLKLPTLVEILSDFTKHYAEMVNKDSNKEDVEFCKNTIQLLQTVIDFRNETEVTK
jgi:hypothetical protein